MTVITVQQQARDIKSREIRADGPCPICGSTAPEHETITDLQALLHDMWGHLYDNKVRIENQTPYGILIAFEEFTGFKFRSLLSRMIQAHLI